MRKFYLLFAVLLLSSVVSAQVVTNCQEESGITKCKAVESDINVMNVQCSSAAGKTSCAGDYKDKTTGKLQMHCDHSESGVHCNGSASDGTKFKLSCLNQKNDFMQCDIADNQGESLSMSCKMGKNGMPNCFGADNDGQKHEIACTTNSNGQKTCTTN